MIPLDDFSPIRPANANSQAAKLLAEICRNGTA
jgi:hypothetical protein